MLVNLTLHVRNQGFANEVLAISFALLSESDMLRQSIVFC